MTTEVTAPSAPPVSPTLAAELRRAVTSGRTRSVAWRRAQLDGLVRMLTQNLSLWERALAADLGKSADETHVTEVALVLDEARHARASVGRWMRARPVVAPLALQPAVARVRPEPLGVALVIAPWNYPLQLQLAPVVGALAAGDAVVMKPSELAPATARLLAELVPAYLDDRAVRVVTGDADVASALLEQRWDHIFYTGGERVGRIVARAAAEHLTPTVLELGGACPVWVDRTADVAVAARRIVWAKLLNAGQTCIAPNHVFVDAPVRQRLEAELRAALAEQQPDPRTSADYGRMVSKSHLDRVVERLGDGTVVVGGEVDRDARYVAPTLLADVAIDAPAVTEETFGPILPIVPLASVEAFAALQRERPKPLALYAFGDRGVLDRLERTTSSGAFGRNVAVAHVMVRGLPFGGVGASGHGAYHGRRSFDLFSHAKAVLAKPTRPETLALVFPPITEAKREVIRRLVLRR
ncbi:aldehyde dehydrogenase family protein [Agrococcus sp. SGAir0287]|uniref:aldehyde dehydrogenase family protein n=1 Tax=Agrococcus sp. SGAir0287 TaxID=2070347 RepID=UPI0010CD43F8|nr:aldehyde dehydrogenase family protein [Agrococcus sp. SGAir0287]QCR18963.1 aldehyde dehydrogenase family protein [Agrococcus sp. SGAir0287]